ncbi:hypothetical protein BU17DRAFT_68867 [Hysterangium stoloniferum]|nr:hypothetical protein BU17DRAFT_68867 [Hysterangium stoloniferum]
MKFSVVFVFVAVALGVAAAPGARRQVNLNQGSNRLISKAADGTFQVDGISFDDESVADQVACALDERDCIQGNGSAATCKANKIDCQSGNGINGATGKLNNESP